MTRSPGEIFELIQTAEQLPYGRGRTAALEEAVAAADASTDPDAVNLRVYGRLCLVSAYVYGGEHPRMFTPFSWLVTRFDTHPGDFDEGDRYRLLWQFKWVTAGMTEYPEVPLERINDALEDMERRYRAAGEGLGPVLGCRFKVAADVHGYAAAADDFRAWVEAPRTELSDCAACEPTTRARFYAATGRDDDAVRELGPALDGSSACEEQPQSAIGAVLLSLVRTGRHDEARAEHARGLRAVRGRPADLGIVAEHVEFCARTGNHVRGLDIVEEHVHLLEDAHHPGARMRLAAAGALLLSRLLDDHGDRTVRPAAGEAVTVAALHDRLRHHALDLAAAFDARNGTSMVGDSVRETLAAEPLAPVSLGGVARPIPPAERTTSERASRRTEPSVVERPDLADAAPVDLAAALLEAHQRGGRPEIEAVLAAYAVRRDEHLAGADTASAETRLAVARLEVNLQIDDPDEERRVAHRAADLAASAGSTAYAALHRLLAVMVDAEAGQAGAVARAEALVHEVVEHGGPVEVARGHLRLAQIALALGDQPRCRAAVEAGLGAIERPSDVEGRGARAALLCCLGDLEAQSRDDAAAVTAGRAALGALQPEEWPQLRVGALHIVGSMLDDPVEATAALDEAAVLADRAGLVEVAVDARAARGFQLLRQGDPVGAARALTETVPDVDRVLGAVAGARRRLDLVVALRQCDRNAEAAEVAETALRMVEPSQDDWLRGALGYHAAVSSAALGDDDSAVRLGVGAAAAYRTAGDFRLAAEALEIAALAAEHYDFGYAEQLWQQTIEDAEAGGHEAYVVSALRCRPLCLAQLGEADAALEALSLADRRLDAATELPADAAEWERAALELQRLRVLAINGDPLAGVAAGESAIERFDAIGDIDSADRARGLLGRALADGGRLSDAVGVLRAGADAALERGDPDAARGLGGLLARVLDADGRADEADAVWQRYSGEE